MHENLISNSASSSHKKEQTGYNELMSLQVKYVVDRPIDRVVTNIATKANYCGASKIAGKKWHHYTASFKASVIHDYENGFSQKEEPSQKILCHSMSSLKVD